MNDICHRWRGRRVLVTGCTGLLGSAVVRELLAGGVDVVGLIREHRTSPDFQRGPTTGRFHVVRGRVEDSFRIYAALAIHETKAVFHLAASDSSNDRGTRTILEAACRYDESLPVVVARPSRMMASDAACGIPNRGNLGVARFGELFGAGDRKSFRVVPATILGLIAGERTHVGQDGATTDFVYANDAARAMLRLAVALAEQPAPNPVDVVFRSGWELTPREMAALVRDAFENRTPIITATHPTNQAFGWSPEYSCQNALVETIAWYRAFHNASLFRGIALDPNRRAAA